MRAQEFITEGQEKKPVTIYTNPANKGATVDDSLKKSLPVTQISFDKLQQWESHKTMQDPRVADWVNNKLLPELQQNGTLDPLSVWNDNGELFVIDGNHRFVAYQQAGYRGRVPVQIVPDNMITIVDTVMSEQAMAENKAAGINKMFNNLGDPVYANLQRVALLAMQGRQSEAAGRLQTVIKHADSAVQKKITDAVNNIKPVTINGRVADSSTLDKSKQHNDWITNTFIPWVQSLLGHQDVTEAKTVEFEGLTLKVIKQDHELTVDALDEWGNKVLGHVKFNIGDGKELDPQDLRVDDKYQGQGIARVMYDYVKSLGYTINRSWDQTDAGADFWNKHRGEDVRVWEQDVAEAPLADYQPIGDFDKPGPFRGADKKLIPHPVNQLKAQRFFEKTPYNFRLFFSNIPGTGKYSEYGIMDPDTVKIIFGDAGEQIVAGHENAITVVYVGNSGDSKVMLTPWMMAHRLGHAIQVGARGQMRNQQQPWKAGEDHFFGQVNSMLEEYYGKSGQPGGNLKAELTPEYNALFNAMGTQRSSRSGEIRRPYEFLYEIFAQYLGTGTVTFNALPANLGYGRRVWGNPSRYLNIKPEYRDETVRKQAAEVLSYDMELMFNDALSNVEGKILVM